ncbi:MAG: NTP transferase domain-containing protein [Actinobacteria bacterium]|nr:NTP transferase domain-containing protein [Actinomycetota bacterium]
MKGVVLAGGLGTRFHPVTRVVNKHLLDVFDEPMVFYPIKTLAQAGVRELVLVTGHEIDQFKSLLGTGGELGVDITYQRQEGHGGIAEALGLAASDVGNEPVVVILGDNIYQEDLTPYVEAFKAQGEGAKLLLKRVSVEDAKRFGVAAIEDDKITSIIEKPMEPPSDLVITGCYMYDDRVFDIVEGLEPSNRGELEITDVNNAYVATGTASFDVLRGWWTDGGTPASKLKASILVALAKGVTFHA